MKFDFPETCVVDEGGNTVCSSSKGQAILTETPSGNVVLVGQVTSTGLFTAADGSFTFIESFSQRVNTVNYWFRLNR